MKKVFTNLIMLAMILPVYSQSYHSITIDGTNDFDASYERMSTTSGTTLYAYVTWDASNIYVGLSGSSPAGTVTDNNRVYHIYIDTDPQTTLTSGNGTTDGETWRWDPTLPFNADYHYAFKTVDNSEYKRYYSGSSWANATITTSNWKGSGYWELSISRSDIGSPSAINLIVYVEEDWSGGSICGGLPSNLFTNTSTQGAIAYNNYWKGYELTSGLNPNSTEFDNRRFISSSETVSTSVSWSGLTILSSGTLTIDVSGELTLDGSLINRGTSANFIIQSDATGTGSLIVTSGTPAATINRYMTAYSSDNDGWHFLSAPVSDFTIAGSDFDPTRNSDVDDLYEYDETATTENWLNYDGGTFGDSKFLVGKGYLCAYENAATKQFTGNINTGSYTKNLSYTTGASSPGWNLLGNPYTAAIDWDDITKTSSVDGTVYVMRASDGQYIDWNGSAGDLSGGIIPAMQGFFVKATATGQSITMDPADETHSTGTYYKSTGSLAENTVKINVSGASGESNEYIQFREDATFQFDHACDAYKLFGFSNAPQIYTNDGEELYSINCLPVSMKNYDLPMGIKIVEEGNYTLSFEGINNISDRFEIDLEDIQTGTTETVTPGFSYAFSYKEGDNPDRFVLHFYNVTAIPEIGTGNSTMIYAYQKSIIVKSFEKPLNGKVEVINLLGQTVYEQQVSGAGFVSLRPQLENGVYVVRYRGNDGSVQSNKVIL